jgi:ERCC4-type nuclease
MTTNNDKFKIIIDNRENKLYSIISNRDLDIYNEKIEIEYRQLDLGDIQIIFPCESCKYIYERKTVNDLIASIHDGRYKEQKSRLMASGNRIGYIIEGDNIISNKQIKNQKKLTSVYYSSIYRDKIDIFFMTNMEETVTFILMLVIKMIDNPDKFIEKRREEEYIEVCKIKTEKKRNIDKDTCYLLQLGQIPNISKDLARRIKEVYPTLLILMNTLSTMNDRKKQIELLTKIDGIGKILAERIIDYLI